MWRAPTAGRARDELAHRRARSYHREVLDLDRTEPASRRLDWLPHRLRATRWSVSGGIWAGTGLLIAGSVAVAPWLLFYWQALCLVGVGGGVLGERAGAYALRRRLELLSRGEASLDELADAEDGEVVQVRGKVRAGETLESVLHRVPGVYRRLVVEVAGRRYQHEAAVAFDVVDGGGGWVRVFPAGARWLGPAPELMDYPWAAFDGATPSLRKVLKQQPGGRFKAIETILRDGDEVTVVGQKTRVADPTGNPALYRDAPQRGALRSTRGWPLIVAKADEEA